MKIRIPYPSKHGDPIHKKTEDNNTSINNKEKEEERNLKQELENIINFYENNITLITPYIAEDIEKYLNDGLHSDLIIESMKEAVSRNKRNWKYITGILNDCTNNKIKTAKQFRIKQEEFKSNKNQNKPKIQTKEKVEYEEINFDNEEEYKKKILGRG